MKYSGPSNKNSGRVKGLLGGKGRHRSRWALGTSGACAPGETPGLTLQCALAFGRAAQAASTEKVLSSEVFRSGQSLGSSVHLRRHYKQGHVLESKCISLDPRKVSQ